MDPDKYFDFDKSEAEQHAGALKFLETLEACAENPKVTGIIGKANELREFIQYVQLLRALARAHLVSQKSKCMIGVKASDLG